MTSEALRSIGTADISEAFAPYFRPEVASQTTTMPTRLDVYSGAIAVRIAIIGDTRVFTEIDTLDDDALTVMAPIPVEVEFDDGEYVASVPDVGIGASGDSAREAIELLKDIIVAKLDRLGAIPSDRLGAIPRSQLEFLRCHIRAGQSAE